VHGGVRRKAEERAVQAGEKMRSNGGTFIRMKPEDSQGPRGNPIFSRKGRINAKKGEARDENSKTGGGGGGGVQGPEEKGEKGTEVWGVLAKKKFLKVGTKKKDNQGRVE